MNKTAIKNFAIWARNKLIADISYRSGLMGITADGIHPALPQSTGQTKFYDIGTAEPYAISGEAIRQREHLADLIRRKAKDSNYQTAYKYIIEEVAYTWFNRLIAVRFMEVNDYLPSHIRVLSSDQGKIEPDLVTTPFDADLDLSRDEQQAIIDLRSENKLDELFRLLFIKQCNALNEILPALFEKTNDYTELLLNLSVIDQDGVVYHLVHDVPEEDFDVERGGQVEIIGWLYQYYNTELNEQVYDGNMSKSRINKTLLPAATTIFTPDWPVRYMVENSLGRLWLEGHPNEELRAELKYYLDEASQNSDANRRLTEICKEYQRITPEDIRIIDPCMGSGHILVYAFDLLMKIYESVGYGQRDAARSILERNIYGLDIDDRAFQIAYFAIMMKARQYNRRILNGKLKPNLYSIQESNEIDRKQFKYFGKDMSERERKKAISQLDNLIDIFIDAKEYGSILLVDKCDWELLRRFLTSVQTIGQLSLETMNFEETVEILKSLVNQASVLSNQYEVVVTNPPYLGASRFSQKLDKYVKIHYADVKSDLSMVMFKAALQRFSRKNYFVAFITTSSWFFISSFEKMRKYVLGNYCFSSIVDFGTELFEGKVGHNPIIAWVNRNIAIEYKLVAVRLVDYCYSRREEKEPQFFNKKNHYIASTDNFDKIPGAPIAYWASEKISSAFLNCSLLEEIAKPRVGLQTGNNDRFLRLWFEIAFPKMRFGTSSEEETIKNGGKWFPHNKGGEYRKWYGNNTWVVNYWNDGYDIKAEKAENLRLGLIEKKNSQCWNSEYYFKECLTWSRITSGNFGIRFSPQGAVFDTAGTAIFASSNTLKYLLGLLSTKVVGEILAMLNPTLTFQTGDIAKLPVYFEKEETVIEIVNASLQISSIDWNSFEISWGFQQHPLVSFYFSKGQNYVSGMTIESCYRKWSDECDNRFKQLKSNEEELNRIFIDTYGLQDELTPKIDDKYITVRHADLQRDVRSLLSYAIGCMFGRYSLDTEGVAYAGGEWVSSKYKAFIPDADDIIPITDEEYLEDDVVSRLNEWLKVVYGAETLEENLNFIAKALGNRGNSSREIIRNYFLTDFFKDHCQTYSVTGSGKRPIYWLFDSGKQNGLKALIYLHRYNADTIGNLRIDYLHRMQRIYESEIGRMQDMIDHSKNAREAGQAAKRKDKLTIQLKECREYDEKLAHLALSRIELDLDDGVKVNYRKMQTANDGKFYEVLADSKTIMVKESVN